MKFTEDEIKNIHTLCDSVKDMDYSVGRWFGSENPLMIAKIVERRGNTIYADVTRIDVFTGKKESKTFKGYVINDFASMFKTAFPSSVEAAWWFERKRKLKDSKIDDFEYAIGKWYGGRSDYNNEPRLIKILHEEKGWLRVQQYLYDKRKNNFVKNLVMYSKHDLKYHYPHAFNTAEEGLAWLKRVGMSERR